MSRSVLIGLILGTTLVLAGGCGEDRSVVSPPAADLPAQDVGGVDPDLVAGEIVQTCGWELDPEIALPGKVLLFQDKAAPSYVLNSGREVIIDDIVHYWWEIPVGLDPNAKIGLHRVVKERRPFRPIQTALNVFALHGTPGFFKVMFLAGSVTSAPDDHSFAVFMAQNGVDVWGIDQAYTLVPQGVADLSFMAGWGMEFDVDNLRTGLAIARAVRLFTGSGAGKMTLLGYSTGLVTGFSALDHEAQLEPWQRQIGAYIPVDNFFKTDRPEWTASECGYLQVVEEWLDAGLYSNDYGILFQTLGFLGQSDPGGESPIIPGVTNLQAALLAGAQTSVIFGFPGVLHFFGGVFDEAGMPVDLAYTPVTQYLEWLQGFNNYGANAFEYDFTAIHCGQVEVPFDDHLGEVSVPVLFVGANGGWGSLMGHTASLLTGCSDVSLLNVSVNDDMLLDIGHVDIFVSTEAPQRFWRPMLDWIVAHARGRGATAAMTSN